jgi:hypothetical protein
VSRINVLLEVRKKMFVNNEITDRGLLHKLLQKTASQVTMDEREVWARSLDGAIKDASRPSTMVRSRLTRPAVVIAAAPALAAVAAALRDEQTTVSRDAIDAVRKFITDGIDSPLYGRDPLAARRSADALLSRFTDAARKRTHAVAQSTTAA